MLQKQYLMFLIISYFLNLYRFLANLSTKYKQKYRIEPKKTISGDQLHKSIQCWVGLQFPSFTVSWSIIFAVPVVYSNRLSDPHVKAASALKTEISRSSSQNGSLLLICELLKSIKKQWQTQQHCRPCYQRKYKLTCKTSQSELFNILRIYGSKSELFVHLRMTKLQHLFYQLIDSEHPCFPGTLKKNANFNLTYLMSMNVKVILY